MLSHLIFTIILQDRHYYHQLTEGKTIARKEKNLPNDTSLTNCRVRIWIEVCLSPKSMFYPQYQMGSLLIPFTMLFLPSFPDSLNSPAHDQQSKPLLQNNYILQRELFHYSKLYWRKMYSHLNFNRFLFILTRDNQFFNWGHYRAKCPLEPWCGSKELRDVQMGFWTPSGSPCLLHWWIFST